MLPLNDKPRGKVSKQVETFQQQMQKHTLSNQSG